MIDRQLFGRTNHLSSRTILGAAAFSQITQEDSLRAQATRLALSPLFT